MSLPAGICPFHIAIKTICTLAPTPRLIVGAAEVAGDSIAIACKSPPTVRKITNIANVASALGALPALVVLNPHASTTATGTLWNIDPYWVSPILWTTETNAPMPYDKQGSAQQSGPNVTMEFVATKYHLLHRITPTYPNIPHPFSKWLNLAQILAVRVVDRFAW